jgi:hypothetical protein
MANNFKHRFWVAPIVICVVACSTATWAATPCTPAEEKQVKDVRDSWVSNWNAKKLDEVMKLYATDATYTPPDGTTITGKDKIQTYFEKQLGSQVSVDSKTLTCSGDRADDNGSYKQDFPAGGVTVLPNTTVLPGTTIAPGKGKHVEGEYHVVLKREKGHGATLMNGARMENGASMSGGGRDRWLIVEQVATTPKP